MTFIVHMSHRFSWLLSCRFLHLACSGIILLHPCAYMFFFPDRISGGTCCERAELSYIHLSRYVFPTSTGVSGFSISRLCSSKEFFRAQMVG
jgi:hypothetical protein